jgi:D-alanine-D-alanine ligase
MSFQDIRKINIVIVAGGWSNERSVSINSGKNVFNSLKNNGYKVKFFDLKKNNLNELFNSKPDLIFNALHGEFGEDGGISCLAKKYNIPNADGSSKGVKLIYNFKELKNLKIDDNILIEEKINGRELTVTVIEDKGKIEALGVTEITFDSEHYDFKAKYTYGKSNHYLPARISKKNYEYLLNLSKIIFKKCMCRSIARLDFILDSKSNQFYFLELNTHPGLTPISLAPEQAQYNKISYLSLIEKIIFSS